MAKPKTRGHVVLFMLAGLMLFLCVGCINGGDNGGGGVTPTTTATPTIPVSSGDYSDQTLEMQVPEGWPEGGIFGVNNYFIVNQKLGRSYAMNYVEPKDIDVYEADFIPYVHMARCIDDPNCEFIDQYQFGTDPLFEVICINTDDEILGRVGKCFAASKCSDKLFVVSVLQELAKGNIPMDELHGLLESATCK